MVREILKRVVKNDLFTEILREIDAANGAIGIAGAAVEITGDDSFFKALRSYSNLPK